MPELLKHRDIYNPVIKKNETKRTSSLKPVSAVSTNACRSDKVTTSAISNASLGEIYYDWYWYRTVWRVHHSFSGHMNGDQAQLHIRWNPSISRHAPAGRHIGPFGSFGLLVLLEESFMHEVLNEVYLQNLFHRWV